MSLNPRPSDGADSPAQAASAAPILGSAQQGAIAEIVQGVLNRCPMIALTGPAGIGKTIVLGEASDQLRKLGERIIGVSLPRSDRVQLREVAMQALGRSVVCVRQPALDLLIGTVATSRYDLGPQVLVVDDVHRLLPETLEFLRRLTAWPRAEGPVWQVILSGRPSFWNTIQQKNLRDSEANIALRCSLDRLTEAEARAIIAHRLGRSESSVRAVIADEALSLLLKAGQGIPGRLVQLLDNALATSAARVNGVVTTRDVIAGAGATRVSRPANIEPGRKRTEFSAIDAWLGALGGVLALTIGLAAWRLASPAGGPGSELQIARKAVFLRPDSGGAALNPVAYAGADPVDYLPAGFTAEPEASLRMIGTSGAPMADDSDARLGSASTSATSPGADRAVDPEPIPAPPAPRASASASEIPQDLAAALAQAKKLMAADAAGAEAAGAQPASKTAIPTADIDPGRSVPESPAEQAGPSPEPEQAGTQPGQATAPASTPEAVPTPAEQAGAQPGPTPAKEAGTQENVPVPTEQAGAQPGPAPALADPPAASVPAAPAPAQAQNAPETSEAGTPAATTMTTPPESAAPGAVAGMSQPPAAPAQAAISATRPGIGAAEAPRREAMAHPPPLAKPVSPTSAAPAAANMGVASGAARMPPAMISALLAKGDALFAVGDVSGARLLYERAASGGSARAATTVGKTYDPAFLAAIQARGMQPDPKAAAEWYRTAAGLGDAEASQLLQRLGAEPNR